MPDDFIRQPVLERHAVIAGLNGHEIRRPRDRPLEDFDCAVIEEHLEGQGQLAFGEAAIASKGPGPSADEVVVEGTDPFMEFCCRHALGCGYEQGVSGPKLAMSDRSPSQHGSGVAGTPSRSSGRAESAMAPSSSRPGRRTVITAVGFSHAGSQYRDTR